MTLLNGKEIADYKEPYIVAELNSSHFGKADVAKQMIDSAKECGCNAVKFQSWSAGSLYCRDYFEKDKVSERMVSRFSLKPGELLDLSAYCSEIGIDFSSTPYSKEEADFLLDQCQAPFVKIASMDINNIPFLRYIAGRKVPIVLSTGMAAIEEIEEAVSVIEHAGNHNICILHCVSLYPAALQSVNLNNMVMLREKFPNYAVGYSDHTKGCEVACAAAGLGAALIEKHFTLDNKKIGWDNQMAAEPEEMKELAEKCRNVYQSLGSFERTVSDAEMEQRKNMRRSITAAKDLKSGHVITGSDISAKRPGSGIPVSEYKKIIGQVLRRDVQKDHLILREYLGITHAQLTRHRQSGK